MKFMTFFAILASLFCCGKGEPQILDGPGMVYIDSEYRNEYANCLPFDEMQGDPYFAIAYLGRGDAGEANKDIYINKIFKNLDEKKRSSILSFELDGEDWYLVIPRYKDEVLLKKDGEELSELPLYETAVVVRCNSDVQVETFNVSNKIYTLAADESGKLKDTDENIWDITDIDDILKQKGD